LATGILQTPRFISRRQKEIKVSFVLLGKCTESKQFQPEPIPVWLQAKINMYPLLYFGDVHCLKMLCAQDSNTLSAIKFKGLCNF